MAEVTLKHVHARQIGYGRFAVDLVKRLRERGITVYDGITGDPEEYLEGVIPGKTNQVIWLSVPSHASGWLEGQRVSAFTMWEGTQLPEAMRELFDQLETIVVPSEQNYDLFSRYHPNVQICYLGVDTDQWHYTPRTVPVTHFKFLVAGSNARKAPDLVFEAFRRAFPDWRTLTPQPQIIHKSPRGQAEFAPGIPWWTTVSGYIPDEDELALYEDVHCYVGPSRGEGFGLQPLQAIAQGIPTILTNAHGHASFAHLGWPVDATLEIAAPFMLGEAGEWWAPDVNQVAQHMRDIYEGYDDAMERAYESSLEVVKHFSVDRVADRFLEIFPPEDLKPYEGSGEWYLPLTHRQLYYVKTNRKVNCEIAGTRLILEKGEEAYLDQDKKRILFNIGALDPVCVEFEHYKATGEYLDTGLTREMMEEYRNVRDKPRVCTECGQVVGEGISMGDYLYEKLERERAQERVTQLENENREIRDALMARIAQPGGAWEDA